MFHSDLDATLIWVLFQKNQDFSSFSFIIIELEGAYKLKRLSAILCCLVRNPIVFNGTCFQQSVYRTAS